MGVMEYGVNTTVIRCHSTYQSARLFSWQVAQPFISGSGPPHHVRPLLFLPSEGTAAAAQAREFALVTVNVRRRSRTQSPRRRYSTCPFAYLGQLHCTPSSPFPFPFPRPTRSKRARELSPHRTQFIPRRHQSLREISRPSTEAPSSIHSTPVPGPDQFCVWDRSGRINSIIHGIVVCPCPCARLPAARRQPGSAPAVHGRRRHRGEQRRGEPLRARHPGQRVAVHLPVHPEGAGAVRQAPGGWHPQGRRHHRQHLEPPSDGSEHGGRGGGTADPGDEGVRGGRARQGVPPGVRRRAWGAAPQGLRLLPLHLHGPHHRHALPLHRAPRLLQRRPAPLLPRPHRPPGPAAARAHVLQGGASPESAEDSEPVRQHVEPVRQVHPDFNRGQSRVLVHGVRVLRQGAQEPLRGPAAPYVIHIRLQSCAVQHRRS